MALLAVLAGYATLLRLAFVAERAVTHRWDRDRHSIDRHQADLLVNEGRRITVSEREVALQEREFTAKHDAQTRERVSLDPMPPELVDRVLSWEDVFAQEQERASILELYALYGSWDTVRQKLPPLVPNTGTDIAAPRDGFRDGLRDGLRDGMIQ